MLRRDAPDGGQGRCRPVCCPIAAHSPSIISVRLERWKSSYESFWLLAGGRRTPYLGHPCAHWWAVLPRFDHICLLSRQSDGPNEGCASAFFCSSDRTAFDPCLLFFFFFLNSSSSRKSFKPQIPHSILSHDTHPSSLWSKRPDCSNPLPLPNPISASPHDSTTTGPADERPLMAKVTARDLLPCSAPLPCSSARRSASRRLPLQIQIQWNVRCYNSFLFICQMLVASCLSVPQDESTISHSSHPCPRHPCAPSK